jgi:hypothetical protein
MHPLQARTSRETLNKHRTSPRKLRIFFSGDTKDYVRSRVRFPKPKLPRQEIIYHIIDNLGEDLLLINSLSILDDVRHSQYLNKVAITPSSEIRIANDNWLEAISLSDFFLCAPGIVMPMCHNIIESMAVGSIPITNYPEWLNPPLQHMKNCIVFDDHDDLLSKLKFALTLSQADISALREEVINYYEINLRQDKFAEKIETRHEHNLRVLMTTERNMAINSSKLNARSILFRPTEAYVKQNLLTRFASGLFE